MTYSVKCLADGEPSQEERNICTRSFLKKEIAVIDPKVILALGGTATSALIPGGNLTELRGTINASWLGNALVVPTWNPGYLLKNARNMSEWRKDLETFSLLIKLELGQEIK